ncbi:MAG: MnhB domain-containing protein [Thermodesulfobacteriota bacterium]
MLNSNEFSRRRRLNPILPVVLVLNICLALILVLTVCDMPHPSPDLSTEVAEMIGQSGVKSPVTAVLLNFRGYDTLLEVMVLFLAITGVWSLTRAPFPPRIPDRNPVQIGAVRLLAPLMCLIAAYLVWQGSHQAGGAFQGGAVFAAAGVLLLVSDLAWLRNIPSLPLRLGLSLGPLIFIGTALGCMIIEDRLLDYPKSSASALIMLIEYACAVSIGLTLAGLFAGGRPAGDLQEEPFTDNQEYKQP